MEDLRKVVSKVLGINIENIRGELTRNKTEEWDSFGHMMLISEIESQLGVKFTMKEVEEIKTFQQLNDMVLGKLGRLI